MNSLSASCRQNDPSTSRAVESPWYSAASSEPSEPRPAARELAVDRAGTIVRDVDANFHRLSASTAEHAKLLEERTKIIANNTSIEQELASLDDELERLKQQLQNRSGEFDTLRAERVVATVVVGRWLFGSLRFSLS